MVTRLHQLALRSRNRDLIQLQQRRTLHEPAEVGRVEAGLVTMETELGDPRLAGVLEPSEVGRAGLAIFVVGVEPERSAAAVADAS